MSFEKKTVNFRIITEIYRIRSENEHICNASVLKFDSTPDRINSTHDIVSHNGHVFDANPSSDCALPTDDALVDIGMAADDRAYKDGAVTQTRTVLDMHFRTNHLRSDKINENDYFFAKKLHTTLGPILQSLPTTAVGSMSTFPLYLSSLPRLFGSVCLLYSRYNVVPEWKYLIKYRRKTLDGYFQRF